jgi:DNA-binding MarR family transcriptional regulator
VYVPVRKEAARVVAARQRTAAPGGRTAEPPDRAELLRFVERFAIALSAIGLARMPARVFAYLLVDAAERRTAAELARALRVSPAAISSAVRTLVQARLIGREREPGARADTYRLGGSDLWLAITVQREQLIEPFQRLAAEGADLLGPDTPGGARMRETQQFAAFLREQLTGLLAEWQVRRQAGSGAR